MTAAARTLFLVLLWTGTALAQDRFFESAGAPVVLIHGFTADIERAWIDTGVLPALAREYRAIALDLRGHGRATSRTRHPRTTISPPM